MSHRVFAAQTKKQPQSNKPKSSQKNKTVKASSENCLNEKELEKIKDLEAKLAHLTKLLKGRRHAGLELQAATLRKRLAKAKEMWNINNLINVKSVHPEPHMDDEPAAKNRSKINCKKSGSKEYGNYYSMRAGVLHMEVHKQEIINAKGLQRFLADYQNKLAKCFQFEQTQPVTDLFATNRINKLSEKTSTQTRKVMKATDSVESMSEVMMEKDLDTLVSDTSSYSLQLNECVDVNSPSKTNFLNQFLTDKVLEFLQNAASSFGDFQSLQFPLDFRNAVESVSDSRLEHLMTVRTKSNRSAESVREYIDFKNIKSTEFRDKCSDITNIIPIKNARAVTDIKKLVL